MKILSVLALILMAGCTVGPTMADLETQAMLTGDWSAVDKREQSFARRNPRRGRVRTCPAKYLSYCEIGLGKKRCSCLNRDSFARMLRGF